MNGHLQGHLLPLFRLQRSLKQTVNYRLSATKEFCSALITAAALQQQHQ